MKIASIITGWHFPLHFYRMVANQKMPEGWQHDMFIIAHRPPDNVNVASEKQKLFNLFYGKKYFSKYDNIHNPILYELDKKLYSDFPTEKILEDLGFKYSLEPNIGGDFVNVNQWMKKTDWKKYDIFFTPHDDNYILSKNLFSDIIKEKVDFWSRGSNGIDMVKSENKDWYIISNSAGPKFHHIRLSFSFFSKKMLDLFNDYFDIDIKSRIGLYNSPEHHNELSEWNKTVGLIRKFVIENNLTSKVKYLSPYYRYSKYNIECERGFLHYTLSWSNEYHEGIKTI